MLPINYSIYFKLRTAIGISYIFNKLKCDQKEQEEHLRTTSKMFGQLFGQRPGAPAGRAGGFGGATGGAAPGDKFEPAKIGKSTFTASATVTEWMSLLYYLCNYLKLDSQSYAPRIQSLVEKVHLSRRIA